MEASKVCIFGFDDLVEAVSELWNDLSYRELQMERYTEDWFGRTPPSLHKIRQEQAWVTAIEDLINKLKKGSTNS